MNTLQQAAQLYITKGWTITGMTDDQFIANRRSGMNGLVALIGIVGLFFYIIPGLLILLLGYVARGTETQLVTSTMAERLLAREATKVARRESSLAEGMGVSRYVLFALGAFILLTLVYTVIAG